jgi:hypothetical protein
MPRTDGIHPIQANIKNLSDIIRSHKGTRSFFGRAYRWAKNHLILAGTTSQKNRAANQGHK